MDGRAGPLSATREHRPRRRSVGWIAPLVIGAVGLLAALATPFAPVWSHHTTVRWPAPGSPAVSSTAFFAPYRPSELSATLPRAVLRAAELNIVPGAAATTVLDTATDGAGLAVRVTDGRVQVLLNDRLAESAPLPGEPATGADPCRIPTRR